MGHLLQGRRAKGCGRSSSKACEGRVQEGRVRAQVDRLVQLLETPVFTPLRLQLLHPVHHPALLRYKQNAIMPCLLHACQLHVCYQPSRSFPNAAAVNQYGDLCTVNGQRCASPGVWLSFAPHPEGR